MRHGVDCADDVKRVQTSQDGHGSSAQARPPVLPVRATHRVILVEDDVVFPSAILNHASPVVLVTCANLSITARIPQPFRAVDDCAAHTAASESSELAANLEHDSRKWNACRPVRKCLVGANDSVPFGVCVIRTQEKGPEHGRSRMRALIGFG